MVPQVSSLSLLYSNTTRPRSHDGEIVAGAAAVIVLLAVVAVVAGKATGLSGGEAAMLQHLSFVM